MRTSELFLRFTSRIVDVLLGCSGVLWSGDGRWPDGTFMSSCLEIIKEDFSLGGVLH